SPKDPLPLGIKTVDRGKIDKLSGLIIKLGNISEITFETEVSGITLLIKSDEYGLNLGDSLDEDAERTSMTKELEYAHGFKISVEKKLGNERFVNNAKTEVVEREREKLADAEAKIKALQDGLAKLG
ncbi:MAG: valyl-tRNA synthetase, partial [Arcticibacterium sp.]